MSIERVQADIDRYKSTAQAIQAMPPERVAAKDAFIQFMQAVSLNKTMRRELGYAFDVRFFRDLLENIKKILNDFIDIIEGNVLQGQVPEGLTASDLNAIADVLRWLVLIITGVEESLAKTTTSSDITAELNKARNLFQQLIKELEGKHRQRKFSGAAASVDSPTSSPLNEIKGFSPSELGAALEGLLSREAIKNALANAGVSVKTGLGPDPEKGIADLQTLLAPLLLALQNGVSKRANIIALQEVNLDLPDANLEDPKLGLFADILSLEGILGLNESGVIPALLKEVLQRKFPELTEEDLAKTVEALTPLLEQALLQLNTANVLSYLPTDLKADFVKLLQKVLLQDQTGAPSGDVAATVAAATPPLKQSLEASLANIFPALTPNRKDHLAQRVISALLGPMTTPASEALSFKKTIEGSSPLTPTLEGHPLPPLSTVLSGTQITQLQEFLIKLRLPNPLKALLAQETGGQVGSEALQQAQLQQINRAFLEEVQKMVAAKTGQILSAEAQDRLTRTIDINASRLGEELLSARAAAADAAVEQIRSLRVEAAAADAAATDAAVNTEQRRSELAAASQEEALKSLNPQEGQLADKVYLVAALTNLQRVKEAGRRESLQRDLQAPLAASLTSVLQSAGVGQAQTLAEQISQALIKPEFAVGVLKRLQEFPPAAATAIAEAKAEAATKREIKKVAEVLPSVVDSLIKLFNRNREAAKRDEVLSYVKDVVKHRSPRYEETNYLSTFLLNQLDPGVKYERRGGIQPALMEYHSQIEKEIKANPGMV